MQLVSLHAVSQAKIHCQSLFQGTTDRLGSYHSDRQLVRTSLQLLISMTVGCLATRLKSKPASNQRLIYEYGSH